MEINQKVTRVSLRRRTWVADPDTIANTNLTLESSMEWAADKWRALEHWTTCSTMDHKLRLAPVESRH